ncbi:MAG: polyprenyl diphosphate synthase, partial [Amylibacter sp.]|nr:polyprenyl diphosphate synthase [Amylibacter sp.]
MKIDKKIESEILHVAMVMDGNGRWANERALARLKGHAKGADRVRHIVRASLDMRVTHLTLFAFSTENWKRSESEVLGLMSLFKKFMKSEAKKLLINGVKVRFIGDRTKLEGPIIKNKTSFIISGRRTYADLLVKPLLPDNTSLSMYFYDLNMKINHKISNNDRLFLSSYIGRDKFGVDYSESENDYSDALNFGLAYGNITSTLRWNHLFNDKLFSNTTLTYSRYAFNTDFG